MGQVHDLAFRINTGLRKYLSRSVVQARRFIYNLGYGVASTAVDDLLKETSSVPTTVSGFCLHKIKYSTLTITYMCFRMLLSIASERILTSTGC